MNEAKAQIIAYIFIYLVGLITGFQFHCIIKKLRQAIKEAKEKYGQLK